MGVNVISFECRDLPIEKVVVFNDRAEIRRLIRADLVSGINEIHVKNVTRSMIGSVRVSGTGDAVIHEVITRNEPLKPIKTESPNVDEISARYDAKQVEVDELKDDVVLLEKCMKALDKAMEDGLTPKDASPDVIGNMSKFYEFYQTQSKTTSKSLRNAKLMISKKEKELKGIEMELKEPRTDVQQPITPVSVIVLESVDGGPVELNLVYQVNGAKWTPSYDFRVETTNEPSMKVSYYGQIHQSTNENWNDATIVLSTAKPNRLGEKLPVLGTLEASFVSLPPPAPSPQKQHQTGTSLFGGITTGTSVFAGVPNSGLFGSAQPHDSCLFGGVNCQPMPVAVTAVEEKTLSTEFTTVKKSTVSSGNDSTRVVIGIINLQPQLLHECIPSKSTSAFLTSIALNESPFVFLQGPISIYLNNTFLTKTSLQNVSPGERFSCSLGVDTSVIVLYNPARKYSEDAGILSRYDSLVSEQTIKIRNTRSTPITITVTEQVPRSTSEKIKIGVIKPAGIVKCDEEKSIKDEVVREEGCRLNDHHNLEWTVKMKSGKVKNLILQWAMEYPKEDKIVIKERF